MRQVKFFDTTLRDGEQAPGFSMNTEEKVVMALQLEKLGVDVIEAGFPITSPGDFEAVQRISSVITNCSVAGLSRANKADIDAAWGALKGAKYPRIHTVIATSDIHLEYKLKKTREQVLAMSIEAVKYAKSLCSDVEFSAEDATRSDKDYLCQVVEAVIDAGATTVNIPDTVGYTTPEEFYEFISYIMKTVPNISKATLSVHCHNDLGMAAANSLAAIRAGAGQVECTINGIGERAGNAALEEIIMMLNVRKDIFKNINTNMNTREIYKTSKLLSQITGVKTQPNKAVIGKNAFSHESGIHQDGVLKNPFTYEIMTPESVGFPGNAIILGKHSGRNAFNTRMQALGYNLSAEMNEKLFNDFKVLADKKKEVYDDDLEVLVLSQSAAVAAAYTLDYVLVSTGTNSIPTATVAIITPENVRAIDASAAEGPVEATLKAIDRISGIQGVLTSFKLNAITPGKDAQCEVALTVDFPEMKDVKARGFSTDILVASANAYINALNKYISKMNAKKALIDSKKS